MPGIGNMLWRIGDILDFDAQLDWTREAGFDGAGFHASAGVPGRWRGIEPADCDDARRAALREALSTFSFTEIHAPFGINLDTDTLSAGVEAMAPVLTLAADLDVSVVTVHARFTDCEGASDAWTSAMSRLDEQAARANTIIALEIVDGFDAVGDWGLSHVGVNLDVGHMYPAAHAGTLARHGGIGGLIRHIGPTLVHLHMHDTDGETDHVEIGTGIVDFAEIAEALYAIDYPRDVTMEMNPDRCSPEGIVRGADRLRQHFLDAGWDE